MLDTADLRALLHRRAAAFHRYERWASAHAPVLAPSAALEAIGALYELLPEAARTRPVNPRGVVDFHRIMTPRTR